MNDKELASRLIHCLDLTSLNHDDTEEKIADLCQKAITPFGNVAAVCVYPEWVSFAYKKIKKTSVKIATVVNFPQGGSDFKQMKEEIKKGLGNGANEIDAVFPYRDFLISRQQAERGLTLRTCLRGNRGTSLYIQRTVPSVMSPCIWEMAC